MAVSLITIEKRYGTTTMAIFSVPLADREPVFMCVRETPYENENRGVVIVDAGKFLKLWRADPYMHHQEIAKGNPQTWRQDRKFTAAAEGFSEGFANPVPLPEVSANTKTNLYLYHRRLSIGAGYIGLGARTYKKYCALVLNSWKNVKSPNSR
jgi:hypothetical protein